MVDGILLVMHKQGTIYNRVCEPIVVGRSRWVALTAIVSMYSFFSAVPSEPLNLTSMTVTARSFVVTWSPPSDLNAPEINYTLRLTGPNSNVMDFPGIRAEMSLLEGRMPFTSYTVVVFAVSEKGPGPSSETLTVMTLEDSECMYLHVCPDMHASTSAYVMY